MPYFTRQIEDNGPILNVAFNVSAARMNALRASNLPVPPQFVGQGLIDTGASSTTIDPLVIQALQINPRGIASMITPSTGRDAVIVDLYDIALKIYSTNHEPPFHVPNLPVMESSLFESQGFHALLGRDVLSRCMIIYDGYSGRYKLAF